MARRDPGEPYYRVDSNEAKSMLDSDPDNTVMVDVRRDDEWVEGHVPGSIHVPVDDLMDRIDEVPKGKTLLFICAAGVRSGLACELAASVGFDSEKLYNVEDGVPTWMELKLPTSYGDDP